MKIFIVNKGSDIDFSMLFKDILTSRTGSEVLVLKNSGKLWKIEASKLLRQAQLVLFVVGPKSHESPYIGWELKKALQMGKQIYCLDIAKYEQMRDKINGYESLPDDDRRALQTSFEHFESSLSDADNEISGYPMHKALKSHNRFTKEYLLDSRVKIKKSLHDVSTAIQKYNAGEYDIFNKAFDSMNESELFDQYKMYLNTSETLVSRRQSVSSFYISVNSALITICSIIAALFGNFEEKLIVVCTIAAMGILLDISWMRILEAYGILNSSKMKIISLIERRLPVSLYDKEWDIMSDKLNSKKYVSFTNSEKRIPKLFIALYGIIIGVFAILLTIRLL